MPYNPGIHNRQSLRLPGYDYNQTGAYFLTINTHNKKLMFGEIVAGVVKLSPVGEIVRKELLRIPGHFPNVDLDAFVIMPNHIHAIVIITGSEIVEGKAPSNDSVKTSENALSPRWQGSKPDSIPAVVQNFKSITTRKVNQLKESPGSKIWQRNYYEHIIRDEVDFERVLIYIEQNPQRWGEDDESS